MKKSSLFLSAAVIGTLVPVAGMSGAAHAQEATATSGAAADDAIIVTARRRAEDVSKVPIAITAFSGASLEKQNVTSLADVVKIAPGINITGAGSRANPFITIRGQTRSITGNVQPGVTTYVNDVPLSNIGGVIPTYDLANLQVVKGPQGTLFGRNSLGGAILVVTQQPTFDFGGYAKVEVGSYDHKQIEGAVNVPIVAEKIALRLATQIYDDGGSTSGQLVGPYTVSGGGITPGALTPLDRNLDASTGVSARASLLIEPVDGIRNTTVFEWSRLRGAAAPFPNGYFPSGYRTEFEGKLVASGGASLQYLPTASLLALGQRGANVLALARCGDLPGGVQRVNCDWRAMQAYSAGSDGRSTIVNNDPWRAVTTIWGVSNVTSIDLGSATLKNILGYRSTKAFANADIDGSSMYVTNTSSLYNLRQLTNELQLSGELFDNKLKYTFGGFYYKEMPGGVGGSASTEVNALFGISHNIGAQYLRTTSKAVYGQLDYSLDALIPGLTLTAGARQTWDKVGVCAVQINYSPLARAMFQTDKNSKVIPNEAECKANSATAASLGYLPGEVTFGPASVNLAPTKADKLTYTIGANWQITPDAMIYATHRRGYRSGNFNIPAFTDPYIAHLQTFKPETLEDFEIGAKLRWQAGDVRGSLDIAAYTGKSKDHQAGYSSSSFQAGICVPQAIGTPGHPVANCTTKATLTGGLANQPGSTVVNPGLTTVLNDGELTLRGIEVAGTLTPFEGLTLSGGLSYFDYKVDKVTIDPRFQQLYTYNGSSPPPVIVFQQPKWTYNLGVDVSLPGKVLSSDVSFNANVNHTNAMVQSEAVVPAYTVADARLTFGNIGGSNVDVALFVKNITDEYYFSGTSSSTYSTGMSSYLLASPRTFGLSVKYSFGG